MHEKVGVNTTLLDPTVEKVGGQLTPLTPCFRGLWALWRPLLPYVYRYNASCTRPG